MEIDFAQLARDTIADYEGGDPDAARVEHLAVIMSNDFGTWVSEQYDWLGGEESEDLDDDSDAHRRCEGYCGKCGGTCYFDDQGARVVANQDNSVL